MRIEDHLIDVAYGDGIRAAVAEGSPLRTYTSTDGERCNGPHLPEDGVDDVELLNLRAWAVAEHSEEGCRLQVLSCGNRDCFSAWQSLRHDRDRLDQGRGQRPPDG